jgi:hypothetical protein
VRLNCGLYAALAKASTRFCQGLFPAFDPGKHPDQTPVKLFASNIQAAHVSKRIENHVPIDPLPYGRGLERVHRYGASPLSNRFNGLLYMAEYLHLA